MQVFLRSAWDDLQRYLDNHFNPLGVIEVVNYFPGIGNWEFKVTQQSDTQFRLDVYATGRLDWEVELADLLSGSIPHLFYCSEIQIKSEGKVFGTKEHGDLFLHRSRSNTLNFSEVATWEAEQPNLSLIGFGKGILYPELSNETKVREFFISNTWVGNKQFRTSNTSVEWKILATHVATIKPRTLSDPWRNSKLIRHYEKSGVKMTLAISPPPKSRNIRIEGVGFSREFSGFPIGTDPIRSALSESGIDLGQGYALILETAKHLNLNALGDVDFSKEFVAIYEEFAPIIRFDEALKAYSDKLRAEENLLTTRILNERKSKAQTDLKVKLQELVLLNEPKSELGVIALFSMIEALGLLPFERFNLREVTPTGRGIDALADFQIHPNEQVTILGALEFEFKYVNFVTHGHERPQVELIVCWELGTNRPSDYDLEETEYPWLYILPSTPTSLISVVVLREIPGLTLSR